MAAPSAPVALQLINQGGLNNASSPLTNYQAIAWGPAIAGSNAIASYTVYRNGASYSTGITPTALTFTAGLASGATSGTLSANWTGPTSAGYTVIFSNGQALQTLLTQGSSAVSWVVALSSSASGSASTLYYIDASATAANDATLGSAASAYAYAVAAVDSASVQGPQTSVLTIYGYQNGFGNWGNSSYSYGVTVNFSDTGGAPPVGTTCISVLYQNGSGGGFQPDSNSPQTPLWDLELGAVTGGYFIFDIKTPSTANAFILSMNSRLPFGDVYPWSAQNLSTYATLVANTWATVKVPLYALSIGTTNFTGYISGTTLTVTAISGTVGTASCPGIDNGGFILGAGVAAGTYVSGYSVRGGVGTYTLGPNSQTVGSSSAPIAMRCQRTNMYKPDIALADGNPGGTVYLNNLGFASGQSTAFVMPSLVLIDQVGIVRASSGIVGYPTFDSTAVSFDSTVYTFDLGVYIPPAPPPPGPVPIAQQGYACRGAWELPGGLQALWVVGNGCFLMSVASAGGAYQPATFSIARVGFLSTSAGPVCIRDNGAGGVACIVDGPCGYYYVFGAAGAAVGPIGTFKQINDPSFLGADRIAFIDGWWIFNQPNSQTFYTPASTYATAFNASNYALKDGSTDNLVTLHETKEELWLIGEKTTEIWYDAGGQYFPFQRLVSTMLQVGCSAKHSIARFSSEGEDGLVWLAKSERGQNVIVRTRGFAVEAISTIAINHAIAQYYLVSDATGFTYQEDGHEFYQITFPSADVTWVYDAMTRLWHQRLSYDPTLGVFHRHRASCFVNFQNQRLVGDYQNGSIYQLSRTVYSDNGAPLVAWRRAPVVWDRAKRERVFFSQLQIEFTPGVGQQTGNGINPQAYLSCSRDGGMNFGSPVAAPLGAAGNTRNRAIWRRLGDSRALVFDVKVYDPVNRDILGATLKRASDEE